MQYRNPVGAGPSRKTWPRCASQAAHTTSVRRMNTVLSAISRTLSFEMRRVERGPSRSGFEFGRGLEERRAAADTSVNAFVVMVPVLSGEGALGSFPPRHAVLLGRELRLPLIVQFMGRVRHCLRPLIKARRRLSNRLRYSRRLEAACAARFILFWIPCP